MKNTQDLLHGNIKSELIALTIPLVLGNILQQFYFASNAAGQNAPASFSYSR